MLKVTGEGEFGTFVFGLIGPEQWSGVIPVGESKDFDLIYRQAPASSPDQAADLADLAPGGATASGE